MAETRKQYAAGTPVTDAVREGAAGPALGAGRPAARRRVAAR